MLAHGARVLAGPPSPDTGDGSKLRPMTRSKKGSVSALQVAEDIVPIGELKAHLSWRVGSTRDSERRAPLDQRARPPRLAARGGGLG